jgi:hypothetical protein
MDSSKINEQRSNTSDLHDKTVMWTVTVAGQDKSQYGSQGERMIVANMSKRQADQLPDRIQNHSFILQRGLSPNHDSSKSPMFCTNQRDSIIQVRHERKQRRLIVSLFYSTFQFHSFESLALSHKRPMVSHSAAMVHCCTAKHIGSRLTSYPGSATPGHGFHCPISITKSVRQAIPVLYEKVPEVETLRSHLSIPSHCSSSAVL